MKTILLVIISLFLARIAFAESEGFEVSCRARAKEAAAETYKNCVTENRSTQLDQIRKDYQMRLRQLKDDYEKDLQKVNGKSSSSNSTNNSVSKPAASIKSQTSKMIAKTVRGAMPTKKVAEKSSGDEMNIQMKSVSTAPMSDDSVMDLPEPIPVESMQSESSL